MAGKTIESLELFTGAGGLALGTHQAGFRHSSLLEWNKDACETLRTNARERALPGIGSWNVQQADIAAVDFSKYQGVSLVAGGVPCQPFSIGGKHQAMNDGRDMFPQFARAIRTLRPSAFIVENVKGLLRSSFESYFAYILLQLTHPSVERRDSESWESHQKRLERHHTAVGSSAAEYNVVFRLLNSADFGVPQTRQRVFIVGFRADLGIAWNFPEPTHSREALIRDQFVTDGYWKRHGIRRPSSWQPYSVAAIECARAEPLFKLAPWRTVRDAVFDLPVPRSDRETQGILNHRLVRGAKSYVGHTGSCIDLPSKTLKAGVHGVPGGENMIAFHDGTVRYLTVREAARIQTFPDNWRFQGAWSEAMRQLGNAVPVELAAVVARSVAKALGTQQRHDD